MPRLPSPPEIPALRGMLDYNPETGMLVWKVPRRGRVRVGDEAGYTTPNGEVIVTLGRHRYPAPQVVAALTTGRWMINTHYVRTIGERNDLRLANLVIEPRPADEDYDIIATPGAPSASIKRAKARERQRRYRERHRKARPASRYPSVHYDSNAGFWRAHAPVALHGEARAATLVLGERFRTQKAAEASVEAYLAGLRFVETHPVAIDVTDARLQQRITRTGPTIAMLHHLLAYDPAAGIFYWRDEPRRGMRADVKYARGSGRAVEYHLKRYRAEVIAWAFSTGTVPRRNQLYWLNDNMADNRLANLALRTNPSPLGDYADVYDPE